MNRLYGRPLIVNKPRQDQALVELREVHKLVRHELPEIDFSDVPNILCETDKYMRAKLDGESLKRRYKPRVVVPA